MNLIVLIVLTTIAVMTWRCRAELAEATRRHALAARVRWFVAWVTVRTPRPAEVQFGIVREVIALKSVGVSGAVQVPGRVDVWISPLDWDAVGGSLNWTADEVIAALRRTCDLRGWNLGSPASVRIHCDEAVPRLWPRAQIIPEAQVTPEPTGVPAADAGAKTSLMNKTSLMDPVGPEVTVRVPPSSGHSSEAPVLSLFAADNDLPPIHALAGTDALVLGRSRTSDVRVEAPAVSGTHCVLFRRHGAWLLDDLSSTNGTFVNGERVKVPVPLAAGDTVRFGSQLTYRVG